MPLQSREVVTLRLVLDCDVGEGLEDSNSHNSTHSRTRLSPLLSLPPELRLKILRYLLRFDRNRQQHTRRVLKGSIDNMILLDSRRILEAPQFKHKKSKQEINGLLPVYHSCHIYPSILRSCSLLCSEGRSVLYSENKVLAIQCGIRGLGSRFRNFGIPVFGPFGSHRLISPSNRKQCKYEGSDESHSVHGMKVTRSSQAGFPPVITFEGKNSNSSQPFYICSTLDAGDFIHALWIMVKSPFAKGMAFHAFLTNDTRHGARDFSHMMTRECLLPWMHNHLESLYVDEVKDLSPPKDHVAAVEKLLVSHQTASEKEPNVYSYTAICELLERMLHYADDYVAQHQYLDAEAAYERVCYEACSMVRTRTGKLVDVSTKVKEGINRVCKLIAISAFRLCELRSGTIVNFKHLRAEKSPKSKAPPSTESDVPMDSAQCQPEPPRTLRRHPRTFLHPERKVPFEKPTTRLPESEAIDHALMSGLLALRLPCATPVPEWNIRLSTILLDLFLRRKDWKDAMWCMRRLEQNFTVLVKEARAKDKKVKLEMLEAVVKSLHDFLEPNSAPCKGRTKEAHNLIAHSHEVARRLWGERLTPRKGYIGLIWTFRWA